MITLVSPKDIITSVPEPLYAQYEKHNGKGTWKELYDWAIEYAESGYAPAQESLGRYFLFCNSSIDYKQAVVWLMRSAEQGFASGQFNLGWCYEKGNGVAQNYTEAVSWYRKAADQGHPTAQNNLGVCYREGKGVEQDYVEAIKWYRKAADQGHPIAQNNLGFWYQEGKGVEQDFAEAVKWYRKAAEQGLAAAQNNLGWCYEEGKGIEQDYAEAVNWYRKAAEQGNPSAQYNLGLCFEEGKGIPNASFRVAVKWYTKATEQNYTKAQIALGTCYQEGKGVQKDYVKAMELFEDALVLGDGNAKAKIDCLNDQIDAERKAKEEAERKVKEEAERKAKEEAERKAKEETERRAKEEAERKAKEEAERKAKEETERRAQEEADRKAKEEAEQKVKIEAERKAKEEAKRKTKEDAERKAKEEAELVELLRPKVSENIKSACEDFVFVEGGTYLSYLNGTAVQISVEGFWIMKNPISKSLEKQLLLQEYTLDELRMFGNRFSSISGINFELPTIEQLEFALRGGVNSTVENKLTNSFINNRFNNGSLFEIVRKDENVTNLTSGRNGLKEAINYRHNPSLNDRFFRLVCSMSEYDKYKQFKDLMEKGYNAELKSDYERMEKYFNFALKINPNDLTAKKKLEKALRKQAEASIENKAKDEAICMKMERKCQEDAERKAKEEAERKTKEEVGRKTQEEDENRLAEYRTKREANDAEFKTFCKDLLAKRAKTKSVGMLWKKSEEFEILTTPLTHNIFNSFRTGVVCTKSENETLMDQFKEKKDIALLIEKMENAYKDEGVTFTIPSSREIVGAQSAKVVGKEGVFLVCHFPEFEE